jgi:hypothetical protein
VAIKRDLVDQWMSLSRDELVEAVRLAVKQHDSQAKRIWATVRDSPLLAAKVRGALSALRADVRDSRDEVMWLMWISEARQVLDAPVAATPVTTPATPVESEPDGPEISLEIPVAHRTNQVSTAPSVFFQQPGM